MIGIACKVVKSNTAFVEFDDDLGPKDILKIIPIPAHWQKHPNVTKTLRSEFHKWGFTRTVDDYRLRFVYESHAVMYSAVGSTMKNILATNALVACGDIGGLTTDITSPKIEKIEPKLEMKQELSDLEGLAVGMAHISKSFETWVVNLNGQGNNTVWLMKVMQEFRTYKEKRRSQSIYEEEYGLQIPLTLFETDIAALKVKIATYPDLKIVGTSSQNEYLELSPQFIYNCFYKPTLDKIRGRLEAILKSKTFDIMVCAGAGYNCPTIREFTKKLCEKYLRCDVHLYLRLGVRL